MGVLPKCTKLATAGLVCISANPYRACDYWPLRLVFVPGFVLDSRFELLIWGFG